MRAFALIAVLLLGPGHAGSVKRSLAVEVHGDTVHVLAHLEVTGKKRREGLLLLADQNRDGRLSKAERTKLETKLAVRALSGVRLLAGTATVSLDGVRAALKTDGNEPEAVMVIGQAPIPPRTERLTLVTHEAKDGLILMVRPGTRSPVRASRGRVEKRSLRVQVGEYDRISWWLAPP